MISGVSHGAHLRINVMGTNKHGNLYRQDMRPVYKSASTGNVWTRIKKPVQFKPSEEVPLAFEHTVDIMDEHIYFAFTYPYSYVDVQDELHLLDTQFESKAVIINPDTSTSTSTDKPDGIYYKRELLIYSPDNRRVDLLTISSNEGQGPLEEPMANLFPDASPLSVSCEQRAATFPNKEVIFVSSRVHSGTLLLHSHTT